MRTGTLLMLSAALAFTACEGKPSAQNCLDKKREKRILLDGLYREFQTSHQPQKREKRPAQTPNSMRQPKDLGEKLLNAAIDGFVVVAADIAVEVFEEQCLELGRGKRISLVTDRTRVFFQKKSTRSTCDKVVDLDAKIRKMERRFPECAGN